jgi:hypothetical protein
MSRQTVRLLLTILMYAGVAVFLLPYFRGKLVTGMWFMIGGAGMAVVCGLLRCYLTEGDCSRIPHIGRDW